MKIGKIFITALVTCMPMVAVAQTELVISASDKSVPTERVGEYDRVKTVRNMAKGSWYIILFPAVLDGYYFGPDAERYLVADYSKDAEGVINYKYTDMDDLDDFSAGQAYLVCPTISVASIVHITPGLKTQVPNSVAGKEILGEPVKTPTDVKDLEEERSETMNIQVFDLQGRSVKTLVDGEIYIINGKKVRIGR